MYPISQAFEQFLQRRSRTWNLKVVIDGIDYGASEIIGFEIENNLVTGDEFEIGTAISSKLVLRMRTTDEIPPNAEVIPYVSLSLADMTWDDADFAWDDADWPWEGGNTDSLPLGVFFIDRREKINNVWTYTCYDALMFANVAFISQLSYPASMQDVWDEICTDLGYTYDSSVVIDPTYTIPVGPAGYTCRQVMGYIAGANGASVYVGKDGTIKFRRFAATDEPVYDMTMADYMTVVQTNPIKTYTRIVAVYDDDGAAYEAGSGDENHTLTFENPFVTQEIIDDLLATLDGFAYTPIDMDSRGYPQIEAGDRISFVRAESLSWNDAGMPWEEAELPWDGIVRYETVVLHTVWRFQGGLKMEMAAPSKSEQQSEFQVDGSLTAAVNRLNQNAVKLGRPYFGVTITREQGLIVEKSDHSSKVILNSDELTFYRGNDKALWFDPASGIYKFNGHIDALSGTIGGWTIGPSSLSGAGQLIGGQVTGTTITGSLIQTSASGSYPRIFLSSASGSTMFRVEGNANNLLTIHSDSGIPLIHMTDSVSRVALLRVLSTGLEIESTSNINIKSGGGSVVFIDGVPIIAAINSKANAFTGLTGSVAFLDPSMATRYLVYNNGVIVNII